jgi:hypothetical protein
MQTAMKEQVASTHAGLEHLHVSAKKVAVEALCQEQKQEHDEALSRYNAGQQNAHSESSPS